VNWMSITFFLLFFLPFFLQAPDAAAVGHSIGSVQIPAASVNMETGVVNQLVDLPHMRFERCAAQADYVREVQ